ncbi:hypothetical protein AAXB25_33745 [Paenibacillus lautus]|uniref:hypothetical protein n=1 Tax=Paenibacillus lautus TaxID=1401 RepID=UPI003D2C2557
MKIKLIIFVMSVMCLVINSVDISFAAPRDPIETSIQDIQTYTLQMLYKEINNSINKKFGTNFAFEPSKVCEINGSDLTIEGNLHKEQEVKKLKIRLVRGTEDNKSRYKVISITELKTE